MTCNNKKEGKLREITHFCHLDASMETERGKKLMLVTKADSILTLPGQSSFFPEPLVVVTSQNGGRDRNSGSSENSCPRNRQNRI